jgi:hypothetical protein
MQRRTLQVTHLGNFQPCLHWHIVEGSQKEGRKTRGVAPVYFTLVADRLGNRLYNFAPEITPPATQYGQMISYVFGSYAFSVGTCYSPNLAFFPLNH